MHGDGPKFGTHAILQPKRARRHSRKCDRPLKHADDSEIARLTAADHTSYGPPRVGRRTHQKTAGARVSRSLGQT